MWARRGHVEFEVSLIRDMLYGLWGHLALGLRGLVKGSEDQQGWRLREFENKDVSRTNITMT